jgi:DNA-binding NarL/FixJ family response regulator
LLAALVAIQALCAVFFVVDVTADITWDGADLHTAFEAVVALALVIGVVFGALEIRRTLERMRRAETAVSIASGALADVIEAYFERWGLTGAEANVALLAIKGFEVTEIAELRGAAASTVRVQLAKVYAKAKVANRTQLLSLFIEDLMGDDPSQ